MIKRGRSSRKYRQNGGECPCAAKMFGGSRRIHKKRTGRTRKMRR